MTDTDTRDPRVAAFEAALRESLVQLLWATDHPPKNRDATRIQAVVDVATTAYADGIAETRAAHQGSVMQARAAVDRVLAVCRATRDYCSATRVDPPSWIALIEAAAVVEEVGSDD